MVSSIPSDFSNLFAFTSTDLSDPRGERLDGDISFKTKSKMSYWVTSHGVDLKASQTLIGYSHKTCATTALVPLARTSSLYVEGLGFFIFLIFSLGNVPNTLYYDKH